MLLVGCAVTFASVGPATSQVTERGAQCEAPRGDMIGGALWLAATGAALGTANSFLGFYRRERL
ncbi:hypothetical protein ASF55_15610 [Methylobacterium sp. Leaf119]|nr:hypothetical protein ASF55_15610 [Methylobacterium sp. Leaf119]